MTIDAYGVNMLSVSIYLCRGREKEMGSERKKNKKSRDSDSEQDDRKSKRRKTERDEEPKSSKRDKDKPKTNKKHHSHHKEKKSKEKRKSKHDKHGVRAKLNIPDLSSDDYFSKNNEFATWLKEEKDVFFSDLGSESARKFFSEFVEDWNSMKLEMRYYEGIETAPRSAHKWKIKK